MFLRLIGIATIVFCLVSVFHPGRHAKHYPYIPTSNVFSELVKFENISSSNLQPCSYNNILFNNRHIEISDIFKNYYHETPCTGGEYIPKNCKPSFKVAILIPYRNRKEQLKIFLNYAHNFLQKQNIHYRIFVIEQKDTLLFNRAKLFNIGAIEAMNAGYPCLILHDVDLIPLASGNIYACSQRPRHMSSSLDSFRFNLPYEELFGGVVSILSEQYKKINGMSNLYEGWGGEDDDLYRRLITYDIVPYRFSPVLSKYTMLKHKQARASKNRYELLNSGIKRQKVDGLNSLSNFSFNYSIKEKALYTHIFVT